MAITINAKLENSEAFEEALQDVKEKAEALKKAVQRLNEVELSLTVQS